MLHWTLTYETAVISRHANESEAWTAHDNAVLRGLDPGKLAVITRCHRCERPCRIERETIYCDECGHAERIRPIPPIVVQVSPYQPRPGT